MVSDRWRANRSRLIATISHRPCRRGLTEIGIDEAFALIRCTAASPREQGSHDRDGDVGASRWPAQAVRRHTLWKTRRRNRTSHDDQPRNRQRRVTHADQHAAAGQAAIKTGGVSATRGGRLLVVVMGRRIPMGAAVRDWRGCPGSVARRSRSQPHQWQREDECQHGHGENGAQPRQCLR